MRRTNEVQIIHHDQALLVISKPSGVSCGADRNNAEELIDILGRSGFPDALPVHRLDKQTSGVMIVARHSDSQRQLTQMFYDRQVRKCYLALVTGSPVDGSGTVDLPITGEWGHGQRMRVSRRKGKQAITHYRLIERFRGLSLLSCKPETGRTHQIRVHLAALGCPLAVDPLYGSGRGIYLSDHKQGYRRSRDHIERPLINRLTLHAHTIELSHPQSGESMQWVAELPKDFRATLQQLCKYACDSPHLQVDALLSGQVLPQI